MGIKDTDDYITARAANPRTGLISPSIQTAQTPCTPMTPGEALRLYSHEDPPQSPTASRPKLQAHQKMQKRYRFSANRWKQHDKGWFMDTVVEVSPQITVANSSATRAEDRFVIPMPSAREPQPYKTQSHTAAQAAAFDHYKRKSQRVSSSDSGLNGTMLSVDAGPRKFAEASRQLRENGWAVYGASDTQPGAPNSPIPSNASITAPTFAPTRQQRSVSNGSIDSVITTMKDMPGGFNAPSSPESIVRKPIGSSPRKKGRGDLNTPPKTARIVEGQEPQALHDSHTMNVDRIRANPSINKFGDLRQLPSVCMIHPSKAGHPSRDTPKHEAKPPVAISTPNSTPRREVSSSHIRDSLFLPDAPDFVVQTKSSHLETQILGLFAGMTNLPFRLVRSTWVSASQTSKEGILLAVNTLTNEKADPITRLNAAKTLIVMAGRAMALLVMVVAVVKIVVAVWQVLEVVLWPVGVVVRVVRWAIVPVHG